VGSRGAARQPALGAPPARVLVSRVAPPAPPSRLGDGVPVERRPRGLLAVAEALPQRRRRVRGDPHLPAYGDTLLWAAAVSPSGRRVATAWMYGPGARTLRLHDVDTGETRVFPLPTQAASSRSTSRAFEGVVDGIGFLDESTAYTSGWAGLRRWDLERGTSELVATDAAFFEFVGPDRRLALIGAPAPGHEAKSCRQLQTRDLVTGETRAVGPPGVCVGSAPAPPAAVSGEVSHQPARHQGAGVSHWLEYRGRPVPRLEGRADLVKPAPQAACRGVPRGGMTRLGRGWRTRSPG
jgi:hypothetical protein